MSLPTLVRRVLPIVLLGFAASCSPDAAGPRPGRTYPATLRLVPILPAVSGADRANSVVVDSVHVAITNADGDTLGMDGVSFPPGQDSVVLSVEVELDSAVQTVTAYVAILANGQVLFRQVVRLRASVTSGVERDADTIPLVSAIWQELEPEAASALPGRVGLAAAYDTGEKEIVVFGGATQGGIQGETWILKRGEWEPLHISGPAARVGHVMAYDAGRGVTVLFGGATGSGFSNDTWAFDAFAKTWTQVTTAGAPSARGAGALAYDAARGRLVMFGGFGSTGYLNETWEFSWTGPASGAWTQVSTTQAPSPRAGTAMAYDAALGRTVLFGGMDAGLISRNDTWTYDGANWTLVCSACTPPVRAAHGMAYDPAGGVLLFGGANTRVDGGAIGAPATVDTARHNDVWAFDGTAWTQVWADNPSAGPSKRAGMGVAYDVARASLAVISGLSAKALESDVWEWNGTAWTAIATAALLPRSQHAMAFDTRRGAAIMYGGSSADTITWLFDGLAWRAVAFAGPGARSAPAMAYDTGRGVVVLFGGSRGGAGLADTWVYDGVAWRCDTTAASPPARSGAAMAYDAGRGVTVMFGGHGASGPLSDTWEYTAPASATVHGTWRQVATAGATPAARSGAGLAYDPLHGRSVLFGGAGSGDFGDTWTYNGAAWTQVTTANAPSARSGAAMAFEASRGKSVLFGGTASGSRQGDLWAFDGADWIQLYPVEWPSARSAAAMAGFAGGSILLFGGSAAAGDRADTWLFR